MFRKKYFPIHSLVIAAVALLLASCAQTSTVPDHIFWFVYKPDIQQGNALKPDMVAKLRAGMTPTQVRYVLGAPLLIDPFHQGRWDYIYLYEKRGKSKEEHRLTVFFDNDKLARVDGDLASQATLLAPVSVDAPMVTVPAAPAEMPASAVTPTAPATAGKTP